MSQLSDTIYHFVAVLSLGFYSLVVHSCYQRLSDHLEDDQIIFGNNEVPDHRKHKNLSSEGGRRFFSFSEDSKIIRFFYKAQQSEKSLQDGP